MLDAIESHRTIVHSFSSARMSQLVVCFLLLSVVLIQGVVSGREADPVEECYTIQSSCEGECNDSGEREPCLDLCEKQRIACVLSVD